MVKFAVAALDIAPSRIAYAAYTGKAAEVLRKKGNPGACTLHKLLYDSLPLKDGGFYRKPKLRLDVDIVIVDEVSLVPKEMIDILLGHNVYVIFLGDPFQLPAIDKNQSHNLLDKPHIFLDQVMRQAAESEIIRLTMKIRAGEEIKHFKGEEVQVLRGNELSTGMMTWADQIICATNKTRVVMNNQMRQVLGYQGDPKDGEKMICLRNYWDDFNIDGDSLVNGTTEIIHNPTSGVITLPRFIKTENHKIPVIISDFIPESGEPFELVNMDKAMIETGKKSLDWKASYQLSKVKSRIGDIEPREFAYGYCITCWKAQGSEWDKVLAIEENFPFDKVEHSKFLYTACTRAKEKLVILKG